MSTETLAEIARAERGTSLWADAWLRLRRNKLALIGFAVLSLFVVIALLTPWIAPYSYQAQNLELGASPPSAQHWQHSPPLPQHSQLSHFSLACSRG